jgi:peptidoglycan biosynthesis protein MviN/MurJ (putative lipid II flippase)
MGGNIVLKSIIIAILIGVVVWFVQKYVPVQFLKANLGQMIGFTFIMLFLFYALYILKTLDEIKKIVEEIRESRK